MKLHKCSNSDYNKLINRLDKFNLSHLPKGTYKNQDLGFVLKRTMWDMVGGITGKIIIGNCLQIEVLWVEEQYRNQGHGSTLLSAIEENARAQGSHLSTVDTFEFQALGFYQKNGYKIFGVLENCPSIGIKRYFLSKAL